MHAPVQLGNNLKGQKMTVLIKKKLSLKEKHDRDREMVKGVFKFEEVPGGSMGFAYKKYKNDPIERYDMVDGMAYTVPRGVAEHLNKNGWYPVHNFAVDEHNKPLMRIGQKKRRFSFQSLEFLNADDFAQAEDSRIIIASKV